MDKEKVIENVKKVNGITDSLQDELIGVLVDMTVDQLKATINVDEIDSNLEFIILAVTLARYNRVGNEGQTSFTQQGESMTYPLSDFDPFKDIINRLVRDNKRGRIIFFDEQE